MRKITKSLPVIILIVLLISGIVFFLYQKSKIVKLQSEGSLGEQIYTQSKNPLEGKIPETNPFSVETNPARLVYPNPFDRL